VALVKNELGQVIGFQDADGNFEQAVNFTGFASSTPFGPGWGSISTPVGPIQVEGPGGIREQDGDLAATQVIAAANVAAKEKFYGAGSPEAQAALANAQSVLGMDGGGGSGVIAAAGAAGGKGGLGLLLVLAAAVFFFARK
jgi:hypothetical protein